MPNSQLDYYAILSVSTTATPQQIRDAYKRAALKHHPDRVPQDSPERPKRTKKFQQINDAYYTLSDPTRRKNYDISRSFQGFTSSTQQPDDEYADEEIPRQQNTSSGWGSFPWSAFGFGGTSNPQNPSNPSSTPHSDQFASVFEEMLREEGLADGSSQPTSKFYSLLGGLSGGAMGFIFANLPGAIAGAVAGNRLGAVRDARGKSVYTVFQELPQGDKARLLGQLAQKMFAHAVGSA